MVRCLVCGKQHLETCPELVLDAAEAKLMGWWCPAEDEEIPGPKTKDEWRAYMRNRRAEE